MVEKRFEICVPEKAAQERLDRFLVSQLPDISRTRLQKLIDEEKVLLDGKAPKASHPVQPGENILIILQTPKSIEVVPEAIPLDIMYEDEYLLVVNKPAGMVVHPAFANYSGTLVNALLFHCQNLSAIGGKYRPGLVHRLDKDTSGLLVVAKDDLIHRLLAKQFSDRTTEREYRAVVWGKCLKKQDIIETNLSRSQMRRTRITVQQEGRHAITEYFVLEEFDFASYLKLKLQTGRTHQIRVHMLHVGHPVFADATYNGRNQQLTGLTRQQFAFAADLLAQYKRQMLHARTLGFVHPKTGEQMLFEASLPADFQNLLQQLRQGSV